jgi:hypothetical protein
VSERERERKKSYKVKFPFFASFPRIFEFLFFSTARNTNFCHKQGFKNTLRLSCSNFLPQVYCGTTNIFFRTSEETNLFKFHMCMKKFLLALASKFISLETIHLKIILKQTFGVVNRERHSPAELLFYPGGLLFKRL